MNKDYSVYTDYQVKLGTLNRDSDILSASLISSLVNDCYVVSSLEDPNLPNADVLVPGDTAIVSGYVVAGDNSLSTRTAYTWDGQRWQPQTGKTSAGDVHFNSNFKVDSIWRQPIDGVLSNDGTFLVEGKPLDQTISGAISAITANVSRVTISNDPTPADLSVHKVTNAQFFDLVLASAILSNDLYVIEDTYVDAYGQEIKNVLSSTEQTNAATVGQVDVAAFELCMHANQICTDLSNEVDHKIEDLSIAFYAKLSTETSARISADNALSTALADKRDKTDLSVYERREGTDRWDVVDGTGATTALPLTSMSGISTTYSNGNIYGCYKLVTYDYRSTGGNDFLVVVFRNTGITSIQWAKVIVSPERSTEEITETEATAQGLRFVHIRAQEGIFPIDDTLAKSSQLDAKLDKSSDDWTVGYTANGFRIADTAEVYSLDVSPSGFRTDFPDEQPHDVAWPSTSGTLALAAPSPTAGHLAALDKNGNPVDSGLSKDDVPGLSVDNTPANVNMVHISQDDYEQLVIDGNALSNTLYVVSGDYINAYGQQIKNIAPGNKLSDAVNLEQLNAVDNKTQCLNAISSNNVLSNFYDTVMLSGVNAVTIESMCSALFELVKTLGY